MNKNSDEMRPEYSFKGGERGKFYRPDATLSIIRLEADVLKYYLLRSKKEGRDYADLVNEDLRHLMNESTKKPPTQIVSNVVAEESANYGLASKQKRKKTA